MHPPWRHTVTECGRPAYASMPRVHLLFILVLVSSVACDGGSSSPSEPPLLGSVTFEYRAATDPDERVRDAFPECFSLVGNTHIHPSWRDFVRVFLEARGSELWTRTFDDVPVDVELRIRVSDRNTCSATNPTGASTENVFANGVLLVRVVNTPGTGVEPGLAFTLLSDGTVMP